MSAINLKVPEETVADAGQAESQAEQASDQQDLAPQGS
jgi:hypothetical protein